MTVMVGLDSRQRPHHRRLLGIDHPACDSPFNKKEFLNTYNEFRDKSRTSAPLTLMKRFLPKNPEFVEDIGVLKYLRRQCRRSERGFEVLDELVMASNRHTFHHVLRAAGREDAGRRAVEIFGPSGEVQAKATEVLFEMANQVRPISSGAP